MVKTAPLSMRETEELKKPALLELKRRLIREKSELDARLKKVEEALNGIAEPEAVRSTEQESYRSEEFARRLQGHFHTAKQKVLRPSRTD